MHHSNDEPSNRELIGLVALAVVGVTAKIVLHGIARHARREMQIAEIQKRLSKEKP